MQVADSIEAALAGVGDVVIAVPSNAFRSLLTELAPRITREVRVAWATKGFEHHTGLLPNQVARAVLGEGYTMAVLSGPTFAQEVGRGLPTAMVVASADADFAMRIAEDLASPNFRTYVSTDITGVEIGGAVKNVIAVGAGLSDGLGFGANMRVALITRGLAEMTRLGVTLGARERTFMGLAGLGDLVLTCTDNQSRNRRCGLALARGLTVDAAMHEIGQVVEGYLRRARAARSGGAAAAEPAGLREHLPHPVRWRRCPRRGARTDGASHRRRNSSSPMPALLAIDQGTTSSRAILFDQRGQRLAVAQRELPQHFPQPGWVEHDASRIWEDTVACVRDVLQRPRVCRRARSPALGITNQRETTVIWDRATGEPIHRAIVWQDRRTSDFCRQHQDRNEWLAARTGLRLDPYFSATKIAWLLDHVDGARARAERGELAFGTIDSWLLWKLTGGKSACHRRHQCLAHRAVQSAPRRTGTRNCWPSSACRARCCREVLDCAADFGHTDPALFGGSIAIGGVAGDQQAATIGQACFAPGMAKSTYGTGCFIVLNTGAELKLSRNRLLSTVAYRLEGKPTFALEGSIFIAGAAVQWLRDCAASDPHGRRNRTAGGSPSTDSQGVYLVPAFTGLGAPYWDPEARGALLGLTRDTGIAQIARATLEAVGYQTRDLMQRDGAGRRSFPPNCAWMAAWWSTTGWRRTWRTCCSCRWCGRRRSRPPRWAPRCWPACRPVCTTRSMTSRSCGRPSGASRHRCRATQADQLYAGWQDAVRRVRSGSASHDANPFCRQAS